MHRIIIAIARHFGLLLATSALLSAKAFASPPGGDHDITGKLACEATIRASEGELNYAQLASLNHPHIVCPFDSKMEGVAHIFFFRPGAICETRRPFGLSILSKKDVLESTALSEAMACSAPSGRQSHDRASRIYLWLLPPRISEGDRESLYRLLANKMESSGIPVRRFSDNTNLFCFEMMRTTTFTPLQLFREIGVQLPSGIVGLRRPTGDCDLGLNNLPFR